jgi:hypothetical protein
MTRTETSSKRPTHRIFAVTKGQDDKRFWKEIGAAWAHKSGKGFNLKLDYLPLNGAEIVMLEPSAEQAPADAD